jgi:hypothetical protein
MLRMVRVAGATRRAFSTGMAAWRVSRRGACRRRGALALFAANDQDARVLLCIPMGLAAIATGVLALRDTAPTSIRGQLAA